MFNPFCHDTTFQYCYRCSYWSGETLNRLKYRRSLRLLRPKYWKFLWAKWKFSRQGRCLVVLIDIDHQYLITRGNTRCIYDSIQDQIQNPKDLVSRLPDDPKALAKAFDHEK